MIRLRVAPEWQERGLCRQVDGDLFYPERGETATYAQAICRRCEVRDECRQYALENREEFGVWGGLSEPERRRILRGEPIDPMACATCGVTRRNHTAKHPYQAPDKDTALERAAELKQRRAAA